MVIASAPVQSPSLWTEDFVMAQVLNPCFRIALPGSEGEGEHIIAMESERAIRLLAQKIQKAGGSVQVFPCASPLSVSLAGMGLSATTMILLGAIPYL